ncbi:MAG: hypothetical protein HQM16_09385 [Deltaproteobacteria bacterium]|nr:hypothetical protein [Deltaproteobacteria bacterium]
MRLHLFNQSPGTGAQRPWQNFVLEATRYLHPETDVRTLVDGYAPQGPAVPLPPVQTPWFKTPDLVSVAKREAGRFDNAFYHQGTQGRAANYLDSAAVFASASRTVQGAADNPAKMVAAPPQGAASLSSGAKTLTEKTAPVRDGLTGRDAIKKATAANARMMSLSHEIMKRGVKQDALRIPFLIDKGLSARLKVTQGALEDALHSELTNHFGGIFLTLFFERLAALTKEVGPLVISLVDNAGGFFVEGQRDGLVVVPPEISVFSSSSRLAVTVALIARQIFDMVGPLEYEFEGGRKEMQAPPDFCDMVSEAREANGYKFFSLLHSLKQILPQNHAVICRLVQKRDEAMKPRDVERRFSDPADRAHAEMLVRAYGLIDGSKRDLKKALNDLIDAMEFFIKDPWALRRRVDFWRGPFIAIISSFILKFPATHALLYPLISAINGNGMYEDTESRVSSLQKIFDPQVLRLLVKIDKQLSRKDVASVLKSLLSRDYADKLSSHDKRLIRALCRHNRGAVIEALKDELISSDAPSYRFSARQKTLFVMAFVFVLGEEGFETALNTYLLVKGQIDEAYRIHDNNRTALKERPQEDPAHRAEAERHEGLITPLYSAQHRFETALIEIGGPKALAFFTREIDNALSDLSALRLSDTSVLSRFFKREIERGNVSIIDFITTKIVRPLKLRYDEARAKIPQGMVPNENDERVMALRGIKYPLYDMLRLTLDESVMTALLSPEFEKDFFPGLGDKQFQHFTHPAAKRYYAPRLARLMDQVQTSEAHKAILIAFGSMSGHNIEGGFWFDDRSNWIDYTKYTKTLHALGAVMIELAEHNGPDREFLFDTAIRMHAKALQNFEHKGSKLVAESIKNSEAYYDCLVQRANAGDVMALDVLMSDPANVAMMVKEERLNVAAPTLAQAYINVHFNRIVSVYTDMFKLFERGVTPHRLVPLSQKLEGMADQEVSVPFFVSDVLDYVRSAGLDLSISAVDDLLDSMNIIPHGGTRLALLKSPRPPLGTLLVPRLEILGSGYRGTRENDHADARYTTRAITTAVIHYGWQGGEAAQKDRSGVQIASGETVIQEIDYHLAPKETKMDVHVSLAVAFLQPIPAHAYKRQVPVGRRTVAEIITDLMRLQRIETDAKLEILNAVDLMDRTSLTDKQRPAGVLPNDKQTLINKLRHALDEIKRSKVNPAYYEHVYAPLEHTLSQAGQMDLASLKTAIINSDTVVFLAGEHGFVFNFPVGRGRHPLDVDVGTVIESLRDAVAQGMNAHHLLRYVNSLSETARKKVAKDPAFKKFFRELLTTGLRPNSPIRVTETIDVLKGAGLLDGIMPEINPNPKKRKDSFLSEKRALAEIDRVMTLAGFVENEIKSGDHNRKDTRLLYLAVLISGIHELRSDVINGYNTDIFDALGLTEKQGQVLKTALQLADNQSLEYFKWRDEGRYRSVERDLFKRALDIAVVLRLKSLIPNEVAPEFKQDVAEVLRVNLAKIAEIDKKIKVVEKKIGAIGYFGLSEDQQAKKKGLEGQKEALQSEGRGWRTLERVKALLEASERMTAPYQELEKYNVRVFEYAAAIVAHQKWRAHGLRSHATTCLINFMRGVNHAHIISSQIHPKPVVPPDYGFQRFFPIGQGDGVEPVGTQVKFGKRQVFNIGPNTAFVSDRTYDGIAIVAEDRGADTVIVVKGRLKNLTPDQIDRDYSLDGLVLVRTIAGHEQGAWEQAFEEAKDYSIKEPRIVLFAKEGRVDEGFIRRLKEKYPRVEVRYREAGDSIAVDRDEIVVAGTASFETHFDKQTIKRSPTRILWNTFDRDEG